MSFTQPTLSDFILTYPQYADPEYSTSLQGVMDEAFLVYAEQISTLPVSKHQIAYKFVVCHLFEKMCWEQMGYPSTPTLIKSRNDSVAFNPRNSGLRGTACGISFLTLMKAHRGSLAYASSLGAGCDQLKSNRY